MNWANCRGLISAIRKIFSIMWKKGKLDDQRPVVVPLKAGSVTFHNGLTFHYAYANKTNRPRRVLAIIYMPDGITYSGKKHPVTDGLGLEPNQPLAGPLFPVVARRIENSAAQM